MFKGMQVCLKVKKKIGTGSDPQIENLAISTQK